MLPERIAVESKTARLTVLIDPSKKTALENLCAMQDLTPSQVVRQLIRDYLEAHEVTYGAQTEISTRGKAAGKLPLKR